jgi:uncharacterized protein involved in outer membrane biogenesis
MNRVLLAIGGLLVGLFALLFAAPALVDWNRYRGIFEEEATRLLGREVRVGGRVNLRLLPVPYVQFEQVRIADTAGSVGRPLFMAEDFTVWLSVGALLAGGFEASDIELRRPVVTLVLDGKGGGSWTSLAPEKLQGGFFPARVAFDAVRITDGALAILAPDGALKSSFEHINGEFSAQALEGPYRIAAAFALKGAPREIRLSTAKAADDGSVRFKGTVRDPGSGVSYSLDGTASDILRNVKVTGELTARLPLPGAMAAGGESGGLLGSATRRSGSEFDVRAELKGDTTGFTLNNLALSFEQAGRPQLATGNARVTWADRTDVTVSLKSHWLDLDRIAGAGSGGSPLELTQGVASAVSRVLETEGRTEAALIIDQATLGSDVVSSLSVSLEQTDGRLNVKSLTAALPGGARISAAGTFEGKGAEQRYNGRINLRGASLARFAGWAFRGHSVALPTRDGAFTVSGDLALGPKEIAGRNLSIEVGRNVLTGDASWKAGEPQRIVLSLEGSELDLTPLVPAGADPVRGLRDLVASLAGVKGSAAPAIGAADADIKLRMDRLMVGAAAFRDAVTELKLTGGNLSLPQMRLTSPDGYMIDLRGDIADLARPAAKGALAWHVVADTAAGAVALARAVGLPSDIMPSPEDAALVAPLHLAGRLQVGLKGPDTHDLAFDGMLAESRVAGTIRLGAEKSAWRDRPTDVAVTAEGRGVARLLARKFGAAQGSAPDAPSARLLLRGVGTPQGGIAALAAVEGDGVEAEFRGRTLLDDAGALGLDGEITLSLSDLARGLAIGGMAARPALEGPVAGTIRIERSAARTKLSTAGLTLAGTVATGELTVEQVAEAQRVAGNLKVDRASVPGLLAFLTAPQTSSRRGGERRGPWSEAPIDLAVLDGTAGSRIRIEAGRLALASGVELTETVVDLSVRQGGLELKLGEGKALGGQVKGSITLEKAPAGARLAVEGTLAGLRLERLGHRAAGPPTAIGGLTGSLKMEGTALSPRGLVVAQTGGGELMLTQVRLNRWNPAAIGAASEAVLGMRGEIPPGTLRAQLETALEASGLALGSPRLSIAVADGALRLSPLSAAGPGGRLIGRASIDLDRVSIEGDWRLEPRQTPQPAGLPAKAELPGITIAYSGPLATFAALEPKLDLEALEREVAVRKVEREVAELERVRKLDEERARQEAVRIEAIQQGLAGPPVQTPGAVGGPAQPPAAIAPANPQPETPQDATRPEGALPGTPNSTVAGPADPSAQTPLAEPPKTVDRAPLTRPAQTKAPGKGEAWRGPFNRLSDGGGN